jgi:hypothetical protein
MKRFIFAAVACLALSGCATDPGQFSNSVNNAVDNAHTAAVATVTIGTELIRAILALYQPVTDVIHVVTQ